MPGLARVDFSEHVAEIGIHWLYRLTPHPDLVCYAVSGDSEALWLTSRKLLDHSWCSWHWWWLECWTGWIPPVGASAVPILFRRLACPWPPDCQAPSFIMGAWIFLWDLRAFWAQEQVSHRPLHEYLKGGIHPWKQRTNALCLISEYQVFKRE